MVITCLCVCTVSFSTWEKIVIYVYSCGSGRSLPESAGLLSVYPSVLDCSCLYTPSPSESKVYLWDHFISRSQWRPRGSHTHIVHLGRGLNPPWLRKRPSLWTHQRSPYRAGPLSGMFRLDRGVAWHISNAIGRCVNQSRTLTWSQSDFLFDKEYVNIYEIRLQLIFRWFVVIECLE